MKILGINFGHDSSACLIENGKIIMAIEEEKMSRIKQDIGWPLNAINRIFFERNISLDDIDKIAFEDNVCKQLGYYEILYRFTKKKHYKIFEYISRLVYYFFINNERINYHKNYLLIKNFLSRNGFKGDIDFHDHHLSHASSAFYTSPFISDLVITSDGRGGDYSFNFYKPTRNGLKLIHGNKFTSSIGVFYSTITEILGFKANRHEGKITGLAAYGSETNLVKEFRLLFKSSEKGLNRYPFFDSKDISKNLNRIKKTLSLIQKVNLENSSSKISREFGYRNLILKEKILKLTFGYKKEDIAFACQKITEEVTVREFKRICKINNYSSINISLSGGVFANVRLNQVLYELDIVKNIFVHPAMGDAGLSLGNAILSDLSKNFIRNNKNYYKISHTLIGADYSNELNSFVKKLDKSNINITKMINPPKKIAKLLSNNKIIGLWNGRMEWGPRALGSRSIILNTFDKEVNKTLNDRLNRTEFMPFAPVVLDSFAQKYFPNYKDNVPAAEYMTITYDTKKKYHELLQATVHIDGTARPQVIRRQISKLYYDILIEFEKISGCGALVNTSFNAHEEPILSNPQTAINALINNRVDFLVMNNYLIKKK